MNDARTAVAASIRQILEVIKESVNEGTFLHTSTRVHDKTGGLFDHREILVLEVDLDRDVLRPKWGLLQRLQIDLDDLRAPNPVTGFFVAAFDVDRSRPVELLYL